MTNKNDIIQLLKNRIKANTLFLPFYLLVFLLLVSCAKMGQPDGGWFDETPPKVIGALPADGTVNVNQKKINIYFDEFIKLDNPSEKVVVSPPQLEQPEIKGAGRRIQISLVDSLKANTTYTIDFSDAISDNNEGNPMGNYTYSFSTGAAIVQWRYRGMCWNRRIWNLSRVSWWDCMPTMPILLSAPSRCCE